jgi:hypothetical protein
MSRGLEQQAIGWASSHYKDARLDDGGIQARHRTVGNRLAAADSGLVPSDCMDVHIADCLPRSPYRENDVRTSLPVRTLLQCAGRQLQSLERR